MANHTPGPWRAEPVLGSRDGAWAISKPGTEVHAAHWLATITGRSLTAGRNDVTVEANARLIAAAPDLLAALKRYVDLDMGTHLEKDAICLQAMQAIKMAEGK